MSICRKKTYYTIVKKRKSKKYYRLYMQQKCRHRVHYLKSIISLKS